MTRINSVLSIELNEGLLENIDTAHRLLEIPIKSNLQSQIKQLKLRNYKHITSTLTLTIAALKSCTQVQEDLVSHTESLDSTLKTLVAKLNSFQQPYIQKKDAKSKIKIIDSLVSILTLNPDKKLTLQQILQAINDYEMILETFKNNPFDASYNDKLLQIQSSVINLLIKEILFQIKSIDQLTHFSLIRYGLGYINLKSPSIYENIRNSFLAERKRCLNKKFYEFIKTNNSNFQLILFVVRAFDTESQVLESVLQDSTGTCITDIFTHVFKTTKKKAKSMQYAFKFIEIIEITLIISCHKHLYFSELSKVFEIQLERYLRNTIVQVSEIANMGFIATPYYLKTKLVDLYYSIDILKNSNACIDCVNPTETSLIHKIAASSCNIDLKTGCYDLILNEFITKVLAYFYDIHSLRSSVMTLNVCQTVHELFKDYIDQNILLTISQAQHKIAEIETQRLLKDVNLSKASGVYIFYSMITQGKALSCDLNSIENTNTRNLIKNNIANLMYSKILETHHSIPIPLFSKNFFKIFIGV
jgi:hypothetical protein